MQGQGHGYGVQAEHHSVEEVALENASNHRAGENEDDQGAPHVAESSSAHLTPKSAGMTHVMQASEGLRVASFFEMRFASLALATHAVTYLFHPCHLAGCEV